MLKEFPPAVTGVYRILNIKTGECYVGASKNVRGRCLHRRSNLMRRSYDGSLRLLAAYRRHGNKAFIFELLIICAAEDLCFYEDLMITALKPAYNERPSRPSRCWPSQRNDPQNGRPKNGKKK